MSHSSDHLESRFILGVRVDGATYHDAVGRILGWASCW